MSGGGSGRRGSGLPPGVLSSPSATRPDRGEPVHGRRARRSLRGLRGREEALPEAGPRRCTPAPGWCTRRSGLPGGSNRTAHPRDGRRCGQGEGPRRGLPARPPVGATGFAHRSCRPPHRRRPVVAGVFRRLAPRGYRACSCCRLLHGVQQPPTPRRVQPAPVAADRRERFWKWWRRREADESPGPTAANAAEKADPLACASLGVHPAAARDGRRPVPARPAVDGSGEGGDGPLRGRPGRANWRGEAGGGVR